MIRIKIKAPDFRKTLVKIKSNFVNSEMTAEINRQVVDGLIKPLIAGGISPVKGRGRYQQYKDKEKYPGSKKGSRPVNLYLSGDMIRSYVAEKIDSLSLSIGIAKNARSDIKVYAEANNVGTKDIVARRFVPLKGETFGVSVIRKIKDIFAKRLGKIINK